MKKIISSILILTIMASIITTTVFAESKNNGGRNLVPPGLAKNEYNLPPGIAKKIFIDIDGIEWARQAIELMYTKGLIRGYGEGIFAPNKAVTKLETVIMALRVMGWESKAQYIRELPKKYKGKKAGDWANGYIAVAYEKGILDEVDMMYFDPDEPVKRYEVAKYVIRALGYEEDAQDYMNKKLPFIDADLVPQGAVGYVYLVNEMNLMKGDHQRAFNPMGTLTRAEMAVLFHRLDQKVDSGIDENEYRGIIRKITEGEITLRIDDGNKVFEVDEDVIVYQNNKRIRYSELSPGMEVIAEVEGRRVVSVKVVDNEEEQDKIISRFRGEVIDIGIRGTGTITIQIQSMKITFELARNAEVYFNDIPGNFDEIEIGDRVSIIVDTKNRAREINVQRERVIEISEFVRGYITDIDLGRIYYLEIDGEKYKISEDAEVYVKNVRNPELEDLKIGYYVVCEVVDDVIIKIEAEERFEEISGIVEELNENSIVINTGRREREYELDAFVKIFINGERSRYKNLEEGMEVELKVIGDVVYEIYAETY